MRSLGNFQIIKERKSRLPRREAVNLVESCSLCCQRPAVRKFCLEEILSHGLGVVAWYRNSWK